MQISLLAKGHFYPSVSDIFSIMNEGNGGSGASHDSVQSGLECMTPASLRFNRWTLGFDT